MLSGYDRWRAALVGAVISGLVGPGVALLGMACWQVTHHPREGATIIVSLPVMWIFAVLPVGPAAFVLGGGGGVLLQSLAARCRSMKTLIVQTAALGSVLGTTVPFISATAGWGPTGNFTENVVSLLPLAAPTGMICGLMVLWLLRRRRLLHLLGNSQVVA